MKQLHRTSTGEHIVSATTEELMAILAAHQALKKVCEEFEFTIAPAGQITEPAVAQAEKLDAGTQRLLDVAEVTVWGERKGGKQKAATPAHATTQQAPAKAPKCVECGKPIVGRLHAITCSEACSKVREDRSKHASYLRRKAKQKAARKPTTLSPGEKRVCKSCGKSFAPIRKDQSCCSKACRQNPVIRTAPAARPTPKPTLTPEQIKANRIALLRALDAKSRPQTRPAFTDGDSMIGTASPDDVAAIKGRED